MAVRNSTTYRGPISGAKLRFEPPTKKKKVAPKPTVPQPKPPAQGGGGGNNDGPVNVGQVDKAHDHNGGAIALPNLDPLDALQNSAAHVSLYGGFRDQLALLRQQQGIAKARLGSTQEQLRQQRFGELQAVAGQANERGVLGSSSDFLNRTAVKDEFSAQAAEARNAFAEGKLANLAQRMQARRDYETGVLNLIAMKNAQKGLESVDDLLNDTDGGGGGGNGNSGNGNGVSGGGNTPNGSQGQGNSDKEGKTYKELLARLKQIQDQGYSGKNFLQDHDAFRKRYRKRQRKAKANSGGGLVDPI